MAVTTMTLLTSCDNGDKTTDVTGTYNGKITVLIEKSDAVAELKKTNNSYSLLLEDLNITAPGGIVIPIGDVTINNVTVTDGKLSGGEEQEIDVTLPPALAMMPGGAAEVTVKVSLTNGVVLDKNLKFTLTVSNVPVMQQVTVIFDGNKK